MKNILSPTDFSEHAYTAIRHAYEIACRSNGTLTLLHAYHMPSREGGMNYDLETSLEVKQISEEKLQSIVDRLISERPSANVKIEKMVRYGFAADEVSQVAKGIHADLVVMSTQGANGLFEKITGTISGNVIEDVTCPVLVIPDGFNAYNLKKIVYTTELMDDESTSLNYISSLAKIYDSSIDLIFVTKKKTDLEKETQDIKVYKDLLHTLGISKVDAKIIHHEHILEGINSYAEESNADLIVMTTKTKGILEKLFYGSKTLKMAHQGTYPLLALHKKAR